MELHNSGGKASEGDMEMRPLWAACYFWKQINLVNFTVFLLFFYWFLTTGFYWFFQLAQKTTGLLVHWFFKPSTSCSSSNTSTLLPHIEDIYVFAK